MPSFVYFDSDVFHRIGATFSATGLASELRERILVSPITMLEVLSHLTLRRNDEILVHIQAVHNWLDPKRAGLLAWPTDSECGRKTVLNGHCNPAYTTDR
jgi:hypothetical protein